MEDTEQQHPNETQKIVSEAFSNSMVSRMHKGLKLTINPIITVPTEEHSVFSV